MEQIRRLVEEPDGVNTDFTTPDPFVTDSFRAVINGQVYEPDDPAFGWTELSNTQIRFATAPESGEVLQGFYTKLQSTGTFYDPGGSLP